VLVLYLRGIDVYTPTAGMTSSGTIRESFTKKYSGIRKKACLGGKTQLSSLRKSLLFS
jgi:hypothetical protein